MTATKTERLGPSYFKLFGASTISNLGDGIGVVAYPWLASALTRNPLLIALVVVVQRLPWLLFSLPAGAVTDRYDRRLLMIGANAARTVVTLFVAFALLAGGSGLPGPDQVDDAAAVVETNAGLYLVLLVATMLLGTAEVLYDNTAQTFMPAIVSETQLEKANGRLWATEEVANNFAGPVLGALLLTVSFSLPFFVDAMTFALSAVLISLIPLASIRERPASSSTSGSSLRDEVKEGFRWLWGHDLLRPLAIILGLLNMSATIGLAAFVLYAQEVLETSPTEFALLNTGAVIGGIVGGWTSSWVSERLGPGPSLWFTLISGGIVSIILGLTSSWPLALVLFGIFRLGATLWNVITVSLRQSIIPDELLGRVNSVYRFFAWGSIPLGALVGGLIVAVAEGPFGRNTALRLPWIVGGVAQLLLVLLAASRLTTAKIEAARSQEG
ncbi:MAG: MFS transporter, partial [Acidimicrobiales bacterium]